MERNYVTVPLCIGVTGGTKNCSFIYMVAENKYNKEKLNERNKNTAKTNETNQHNIILITLWLNYSSEQYLVKVPLKVTLISQNSFKIYV